MRSSPIDRIQRRAQALITRPLTDERRATLVVAPLAAVAVPSFAITAESPMKVVIQIPCRDEAATLSATIAGLPRTIAGIDEIAIVVVDDGSFDDTAKIAASLGAHVVSLRAQRGLAVAFMTGIETALALGADIVVNTDGDNQYVGEDAVHLVLAVMNGDADVAIGARPIASMPGHGSASRRRCRSHTRWVSSTASR